MSKNIPDVVELTQQFVRLETTKMANNERAFIEMVKPILEQGGFTCTVSQYDPENPDHVSLVAQLNPTAGNDALCFGGHFDTVPFGDAAWKVDPTAAEIIDGKLYGRGSTDMKGGAAAMICACLNMAERVGNANLVLHLYGGEELGLLGSTYLATKAQQEMGKLGAVVITEPTGNHPQVGHKGAMWFRFSTKGVTAHASMPEKGDNALAKILPTAMRLKDYWPNVKHEYLGESTATFSNLHSGLNVNSVPDSATANMDIRTVAGQDIDALKQTMRDFADPEVEVEVVMDIPPVWTDPEHEWCKNTRQIVKDVTGIDAGVECAIFATDASSLRLYLKETPMIILGPGAQDMAHVTDEYVEVKQLRDAQDIYQRMISYWYNL